MHRIQGWTGLRAAVIALGLVAWTATGATAAPLVTYTTSGEVDTTFAGGVSGTPVISFIPLTTTNTVDPNSGPTNASLGEFYVNASAGSGTTTYNNTRFQISFVPVSYGSTSLGGDSPVVISGVLNGVVNGPSNSNVTATFDPIPNNGSFSLGGGGAASFSLPTTSKGVTINTLQLVPTNTNGGITTAQGLVTLVEAPVPEPSTIALFLTTVGGLGLRRYVLSRRRPARV